MHDLLLSLIITPWKEGVLINIQEESYFPAITLPSVRRSPTLQQTTLEGSL